jgi:anaerobic selenocysteine-containing dehydrogenase
VPLPKQEIPEGRFYVSTRRGKQFNSMVHAEKDAITGAVRDAVFMNSKDAAALGLREGDQVVLRNDIGTYTGRVKIAQIARKNLQVLWPEGNVLLNPKKRSPESGVPDYNAYVTVEKAEAPAMAAD